MRRDRRTMRFCAMLVVGWLPVLAGAGAVPSAAGLYELAASPHPYFVPAHAWLLYCWSPVVVASACLLLLSPGLFLALAVDSAGTVASWIVSASALSLVAIGVTTGVLQPFFSTSIRGSGFACLVAGCALLCFAVALLRGGPSRWPSDQSPAAVGVSYVIAPLLLLVALTPKFYWETFNGDGAHAYESARLLLVQPLPFWGPAAGPVAAFPGLTSMLYAYPTSWFIRLFGELEVSARLPLLLYLVGLHAAVVAVAEHGARRAFSLREHWMLWLQLAVFTVVMAFSATYSPYSADIALPATQDTFAVVCFLGFVLGFIRGVWSWAVGFLVLTYVSLPNGLLLGMLWLMGVWVVWRPRPRAPMVTAIATLVACIVLSAVAARALELLGFAPPGGEYGVRGLMKRFAYLQCTDWQRLLFLLLPAGIAPALSLVAWKRQDRIARALTLVTVAYWAFFFVQAQVSLHHFVPAMLLPLVVLWRTVLMRPPSRGLRVSIVVAAALALFASLPNNARPHMTAREIGLAVEDRIGGYAHSEPLALRASALLGQLFPIPWDPRVPERAYGGSPLVWNYYAHQPKPMEVAVNYILQRAIDPPPDGARAVATEDGMVLFVRSDAIWKAHADLRPPAYPGSRLYRLPSAVLFGRFAGPDAPRVIDLKSVIRRLVRSFGIAVGPLARPSAS